MRVSVYPGVHWCVCVQGCVRAHPWARVPAAARPAGARDAGASPSAPQDVEAAMRLPLAFAVLLLASTQALAEEMGATDDLNYWSDWSDGDQGKVSPAAAAPPAGPAGVRARGAVSVSAPRGSEPGGGVGGPR